MSASEQERRQIFIGVNLITEEVTAIAVYSDLVRDAYMLRAEVAEGTIYLGDDDDSYEGKKATEIALASQGIGLGWTFVKESRS